MKGLVTFAFVATLVAPAAAALAQQPPPPQGQPGQGQPPQGQPSPGQPPQGPSSQGQPSQGQAPAPQQGGGQSAGLTVASDSLVGTKVRDAQGKEVGEITKLLIDVKQGKVTSAMIKQGGSLGMGGRELSVPWETLQIQRGRDQELVATLQQPLLDQAPSASPSSGQDGKRQK